MSEQKERLRDYHKGFLIVGIVSFGIVYALLEYEQHFPVSEQLARTMGGTLMLLMVPVLGVIVTLNKPARSRFFLFVVLWVVCLVLTVIGVFT